jgi:hypothetical protein
MNTALLINKFQGGDVISVERATNIIRDLSINLQINKSYCNEHEDTLTEKEKQQNQEKSNKIQDEIDYYKTRIFYVQQTYQDDEQNQYGYSAIPKTHSDEEHVLPLEEENRQLKQQVANLEATICTLYQLLLDKK